ncbi:hypothetical protein PF023_08035 [Enterococcus thailandicus]|uniref:hypothetical protein n=1 Tax=Enterococcus thailandicus TaxID=417368 RepID=UPI0022EBF00A|nr:hypothetical protein [Enterococcus thailandicus]MDA3973991.1 hypothetical protein [Enterococcus thailandicus]MDA3976199.1 hypothetical protein [Enterococcus thailandicus]MDA3981164.1 hypothetical protein [Enterococcus thailandicus]
MEKKLESTKLTIYFANLETEEEYRQTIGSIIPNPEDEKVLALGDIFQLLTPKEVKFASVLKTEATSYRKS